MTDPPQSTNDPDDNRLLQAIAHGDSEAFTTLYARHHYYLLACARHYVDDPHLAEEAVQDGMVAVWHTAGSFRGQSSVRTWLVAIVRHKISTLRKRARRTTCHEIGLTTLPPAQTPFAIEQEQDIAQDDLWTDALCALPPDLHTVLHLTFVEELTASEIAQRLRIPPGTVKSRLRRAKTALQDVLRRRNEDSAYGPSPH